MDHAPASRPTPPAPGTAHQARLARLAEVVVRVGLNLQPGQELVMTAPLDALPPSA